MSVVRAKTKADIIHGSDTSRAIDPGENQLQALDSITSIPKLGRCRGATSREHGGVQRLSSEQFELDQDMAMRSRKCLSIRRPPTILTALISLGELGYGQLQVK
jgi:hypothetical protein